MKKNNGRLYAVLRAKIFKKCKKAKINSEMKE
jgi:hypothetical protein